MRSAATSHQALDSSGLEREHPAFAGHSHGPCRNRTYNLEIAQGFAALPGWSSIRRPAFRERAGASLAADHVTAPDEQQAPFPVVTRCRNARNPAVISMIA